MAGVVAVDVTRQKEQENGNAVRNSQSTGGVMNEDEWQDNRKSCYDNQENYGQASQPFIFGEFGMLGRLG